MIKRFEEIKVWQDARILTKHIYDISKVGKFSRDYGPRDQIQRASVSIMSNIAEGYERDSKREFAKFLGYAKGSAGEGRNLLCVAKDQEYITASKFIELYDKCVNVSLQISNFEKYLRKSIR
ncbi:MAG: four helix bundle protein [Ignavibacteriales bacterium]|nr:four helix bundle protein [Ignavibacteriales bacterium]